MTHLRKYMNYKYVKYMVYILYFLYFIYKKYMKTVLKSVVFVAVLIMLVLGVRNILSVPQTGLNETTGMHNIHKYPFSYDVCFIGRSPVVSNTCNQELYEKYGIASINAGVSGQRFPLTVYTLEEVFEYQSPKVVFFDTRGLFDTVKLETESMQDESYLHFSLDNIKTNNIKKKALQKIKQYNKEIDEWDYYSKLYYNHDNWKNITKDNFLSYNDTDGLHGNISLLEVAENITNTYVSSDRYGLAEIPKANEQYLTEMAKLCNDAGSELILITTYADFTKAQQHEVILLAKKLGLKYININEYTLKIGLQHSLDFNTDSTHMNLSGAIKLTHFLGDYLQKNYDFTDRRNDSSYNRYEEEKEKFEIQKEYIYSKQALLSATSFYKYLTELNNINHKNNIILITVYNDAFRHLTKKEQELLHKLGLRTNFNGKDGGSYAAIINDKDIYESFSFVDTAELEIDIGNVTYEIVSGGLTSTERSSILIDEKSAIQCGRGFNFVVYNTELEKTTSSCYFNTAVLTNPAQSRYKLSTSLDIQQETDPNIWENLN